MSKILKWSITKGRLLQGSLVVVELVWIFEHQLFCMNIIQGSFVSVAGKTDYGRICDSEICSRGKQQHYITLWWVPLLSWVLHLNGDVRTLSCSSMYMYVIQQIHCVWMYRFAQAKVFTWCPPPPPPPLPPYLFDSASLCGLDFLQWYTGLLLKKTQLTPEKESGMFCKFGQTIDYYKTQKWCLCLLLH